MPLARRTRVRDEKEVRGRAAALRALVLLAAGGAAPAGEPPFSPAERKLLERPAAEWSEQERTDALWRGEALGALAWALSLVEALPPYDAPFDHAALARDLATEGGALRPAAEIERACAAARLWHWRARTTLVAAGGTAPLPERFASFAELVAATAMRGHEDGLLPAPLRGDFPAFGRVYRRLEPAQHALAHSIARERHYALAWLCGDSPWDESPTDT